MGVLEQVLKLKGQGISDLEIINSLSQQGISPKEIDMALKQAQIKNAVSDFKEDEELQPSIMQDEPVPVPSAPQEYVPQNPEQYASQPQENYSQYPPQQEYYAQQYSPQQYSEYASPQTNTDTIIEIADQIFSEKIKKIQKQVEDNQEINSLLQSKIENINERLKKIENLMDRLQLAILEKVGSYGQNLESIKKEMGMMQDSFSKMISQTRKQSENITEKLKKI